MGNKGNQEEMIEDAEEFETAKVEYMKFRLEERERIINYLKRRGFERGGRTPGKYSSGSRFSREYDLSNWLYFDINKGEKKICISLQTFDKDSKSGNYHVLMDRLGIYIYAPGSSETTDAIDRMLATNIDLPMTDKSLENLANILDTIIDCLNYKEEKSQEQEIDYRKLVENNEKLKKRLAYLEEELVPVKDDMSISKQLFNVEFKDERREKFMKVKGKYKEKRSVQGKDIVDFLQEHYICSGNRNCFSSGGAYTSGKRFYRSYNNSNWMYLDVRKKEGGKWILISLQTFDRDPKIKNYHVLMDRIGIYIYHPLDTNPDRRPDASKAADAIHKMLATNIDLPMADKSLENLEDILNKITACLNRIEEKIEEKCEDYSKLKEDKEFKGWIDNLEKELVPVDRKKGISKQLEGIFNDLKNEKK